MSPLNRDNHLKAELREILLARRRQISFLDRQTAATKAAELLLTSEIFQNSQEIACYYPFNNEFDAEPMIKEIWQAKKNCYLPVISLARAKTPGIANKRTGKSPYHLNFVQYQEDTVLRPNRYNIPEPVNDNIIAPNKLDLILLPLLGFDLKGNRLGMGSGYYDRTLQGHKQGKKPVLLGVGYEAQCVSSITNDSWDVALDGVITEKQIIFF